MINTAITCATDDIDGGQRFVAGPQHLLAGPRTRSPGSMTGRSDVQVNERCQMGVAIVRAALICFSPVNP
jgi:hypothetical protein